MTNSNEYWAGADMVFSCLIDKKRTLAFKEAIQDAVKKDDVVVDIGTGSGILAMLAADAGAKKVYALEADINLCGITKQNFKLNNYDDVITLIEGDASLAKLPEKVDVVICEMIATGLIDELQIPVINNILNYTKEDARILPMKMKNFLDLVHVNDEFYGHKIKFIQYEYGWEPMTKAQPLSDKIMYLDVNFRIKNQSDVDQRLLIKINKKGILNGLRITNETLFPNGSTFDYSDAYCMPLVLPIQDIPVEEGDELEVLLQYKLCAGINNLKYEVTKK